MPFAYAGTRRRRNRDRRRAHDGTEGSIATPHRDEAGDRPDVRTDARPESRPDARPDARAETRDEARDDSQGSDAPPVDHRS